MLLLVGCITQSSIWSPEFSFWLERHEYDSLGAGGLPHFHVNRGQIEEPPTQCGLGQQRHYISLVRDSKREADRRRSLGMTRNCGRHDLNVDSQGRRGWRRRNVDSVAHNFDNDVVKDK